MANKPEQEAATMVASAMREALKTLAQEAQDAKHLLAEDAANALKVLNSKNAEGGSDHDILIELKTQMAGVRNDIKSLSDNTAGRISHLEATKLNVADSYPALYKCENDRTHNDFELRLRGIETNVTRIMTFGTVLVIAVGIVEFILTRLWK